MERHVKFMEAVSASFIALGVASDDAAVQLAKLEAYGKELAEKQLVIDQQQAQSLNQTKKTGAN